MTARLTPLQLCLLLAGLLVATRATHAAFAFAPPDATLALMFLGGMWLRRWGAFVILMAAAVAADWIAVGTLAVPATCITPAYAGLVPAYLAVWGIGWWLERRSQSASAAAVIAAAWAATSLGFLVSSGFWYAFSGEFASLTLAGFAAEFGPYYGPYIGVSVTYVMLAWTVRCGAARLAVQGARAAGPQGRSAS